MLIVKLKLTVIKSLVQVYLQNEIEFCLSAAGASEIYLQHA